jgi:hypothetical protein
MQTFGDLFDLIRVKDIGYMVFQKVEFPQNSNYFAKLCFSFVFLP